MASKRSVSEFDPLTSSSPRSPRRIGRRATSSSVFLGQPAGHEVIAAVPGTPMMKSPLHRTSRGMEHLVGEAEPVPSMLPPYFVGARVWRGEKFSDEVAAVEGECRSRRSRPSGGRTAAAAHVATTTSRINNT